MKVIKKKKILLNKGWYKNLNGGYTESHCMKIITKDQLKNIDIEYIKKL